MFLFIFVLLWWKKGKVSVELETYDASPVKFYKRRNGDYLRKWTMRKGSENSEFLLNRDPYISYLLVDRSTQCAGNFIGFKNLFAKLSNVIIDPEFGKGRKGGENMTDVMNQDEEEEFYSLSKGFFKLPCNNKVIEYEYGLDSHLNNWMNMIDSSAGSLNYYEILDWTIAVQRYEYVNMYHTMTDWYNTFLVIKVFKLDPKNVTVLWVDGHPRGGLDSTWSRLFGRVMRIGDVRGPTLFTNMIWGIVGYDSPLDEHYLPEVAYLEEFRNFFLSKYNIIPEDDLNCMQMKILIIWRRDYVAHPRNPSGSVARKIKNEDELLHKIQQVFKGHIVRGLQIDKLTMQKQLELTSRTDVLIGMHGAGLSHTLFLPRHAGLIEMFPLYHPSENIHFRSMAEWRHLYYMSWSNFDMEKELDNQLTIVNVDEVAILATEMKQKMCAYNDILQTFK